jgi:hypothetical protein
MTSEEAKSRITHLIARESERAGAVQFGQGTMIAGRDIVHHYHAAPERRASAAPDPTPSRATDKRNQAWRNARYAAIHARIRRRGLEAWFEAYMRRHYGSPSLAELDNEELEAVYRTVIGRK